MSASGSAPSKTVADESEHLPQLQVEAGVASLGVAFERVRSHSLRLCEPLELEDFGLQPMPDASPPKWHLAHTTWFFETFLLKAFDAGWTTPEPLYEYLFNSYYNGVGAQFERTRRGTLSRPTVAEVFRYRSLVDDAVQALIAKASGDSDEDVEVRRRLVLGLHHEQQHQELLLTDLKYAFGCNPLYPAYRPSEVVRLEPSSVDVATLPPSTAECFSLSGGVYELGCSTDGCQAQRYEDFCFDNEGPRHEVLIRDVQLDQQLVTNGEYLAFLADDAYERSELWLANAWTRLGQEGWRAPLYWRERDGEWFEYRLSGLKRLDPAAPVLHLSYYEADAYARWSGKRLPTEAEWELGAQANPHWLEAGAWQWTQSSYGPYPGYQPLPGTLGEYNGKFMSEQLVLRGQSHFTPPGHGRISYRNFFYPPDRWQLTGLRLANDP